MDETENALMKDEERVLQAIGRAQDVLAAYIQPGHRDEKRTLSELMVILDDHELVQAHERLTWKTGRPAEHERRKEIYYDAQRKHIEDREDMPNGK